MRKIIDKVIEIMCTGIMGIMVIAVCWQVITRYVLKNPSTMTEELLRYMLIWTTMTGAAYAYGRRKHLSITFLTKKLSPVLQKVFDIGVQIITISFSVIVLLGGGGRLFRTAIGQVSAAIGIPMQYIYLSVVVCGILLIFYSAIFIFEDLKHIKVLKENEGVGKVESV
ncbi:MAG: TRAP transporter small permease [Clostridium sp.]|nr:TRAP transporter small permease [Clostridium sp.]MDU7083023.1 TRAP transporter small permease [Clostridium sp.]